MTPVLNPQGNSERNYVEVPGLLEIHDLRISLNNFIARGNEVFSRMLGDLRRRGIETGLEDTKDNGYEGPLLVALNLKPHENPIENMPAFLYRRSDGEEFMYILNLKNDRWSVLPIERETIVSSGETSIVYYYINDDGVKTPISRHIIQLGQEENNASENIKPLAGAERTPGEDEEETLILVHTDTIQSLYEELSIQWAKCLSSRKSGEGHPILPQKDPDSIAALKILGRAIRGANRAMKAYLSGEMEGEGEVDSMASASKTAQEGGEQEREN